MKTKTMKAFVSTFVALFFVVGVICAAERKELGWIDKGQAEGLLKQEGHGYLTVKSGYKEPKDDPKDGTGYSLTLRCENKEKKDYNVSMWVSDDWKKFKIISVKKR